ncbi:MAG: hypothetical protein HKM06_00235 [Spirochaetales bacterium]|nr:hypothetical protein [Spirochaetales bacterium]
MTRRFSPSFRTGRSALAWALAFLFCSCAPQGPSFLDRVKALPPQQASPRLSDLLRHWPVSRQPDDSLVLTWRSWVGETSFPLLQKKTVTFVYYDFTHQATSVDLEANFAQNKPERLLRFEGTPLFYSVFSIPNLDKVRYSFLVSKPDGTQTKVLDPFNVFAEAGPPPENLVPDLSQLIPRRNYIWAETEPRLSGQNLVILLPPDYLRNFSRSYAVAYVVGMPDGPWDQPLVQAFEGQKIGGLIVVNLGVLPANASGEADLNHLLQTTVKPWVDLHYRTLSDKDNTLLIGWGASASAVAQVAQTHPNTYVHYWVPESPQSDWASGVVPFLSRLYPGNQP